MSQFLGPIPVILEEELKEALQEDDISLFSQQILYWAWPISAPACLFTFVHLSFIGFQTR